MQLLAPFPFEEAIKKFGARSPVTSILTSDEWSTVSVGLRERAFFSARVESVRFLQRAKDLITDHLTAARDPDFVDPKTGETERGPLRAGSRAAFIAQMQDFALAEGLGPLDPKDKGTIRDVTSNARLALIFDTNVKSAHDFGAWKQGMDPDVLDEFPAQRFIRVRSVTTERDYHKTALGTVRLKTDLSYWIGLNKDFQVPWGPWGFNSGCDVEDVDRAEAEDLRLLKPGQKVTPQERRFNDRLLASTRGLDEKSVSFLDTVFGDQIEHQDGAVWWRGQKSTVKRERPRPAAVPEAPAGPPEIPYAAETTWRTGAPQPGQLGGVVFEPVTERNWWEKVPDVAIDEPAALAGRTVQRAGILVEEADGRIWLAEPTNHFGKRRMTWPGGTTERGLSLQQNALKEMWEETGLRVEISGYVGDFRDSNTGRWGRLYRGRRVGGAPWDAKIEAGIRDARTGLPSAESATVRLVTPEHAAQLLHRTDDQAQLMAVHPIPLSTATRGKGSEALKKFVQALEPRAKAFEQRESRAGRYHGNAWFHELAEIRGANGEPQLVTEAEMDVALKSGGHVEIARGIKGFAGKSAAELADEYRHGDCFAGHGIFGSGTYGDSWKGGYRPSTGAENVCWSYGAGGAVIRMALKPGAKVVKLSELERLVPERPREFPGYRNAQSKPAEECWRGMQALLAGYDAIEVDGKSRNHGAYGHHFYVILDRTKILVQKTNVKNRQGAFKP